MGSNPPRRAGPLWLWLLALIMLLAAVWVLIDGLTDEDFTGEATTPPAEEVERR